MEKKGKLEAMNKNRELEEGHLYYFTLFCFFWIENTIQKAVNFFRVSVVSEDNDDDDNANLSEEKEENYKIGVVIERESGIGKLTLFKEIN